ncbi:MAG: hypothetical protein ABIC40_02580 [bacterium]
MRSKNRSGQFVRDERGVVLIVVLIFASNFAILAYTALTVSLRSLESTDSYHHSFIAKQTAEGAVNRAAYGLLVDPAYGGPKYLDPSYALSVSEDALKTGLIDNDQTWWTELNSFPSTISRSAYTQDSQESTYNPDTDLLWGNRDDATYRYHDDTTFSEDWPAYEFAQAQRNGNLYLYGVGEVSEPEGDQSLFSFVRGNYPNIELNYDVRETGVTEPSRIGPYPIIESTHPYQPNKSEAWTVTYMQDPEHSGRNLTGLRLMADIDKVQIDSGDHLYIAAWLENKQRFQSLAEILGSNPNNDITNFANSANEVFSDPLNTSAIGLFLMSDNIPPVTGKNYGFRVNGIRYDFDSDQYQAFYETPHPYDLNVPRTSPVDWNIQVIYSHYQAPPASPMALGQQMRIRFDNKFSLDAGDTLYLVNACDPAAPVAAYTSAVPPPADGYSPYIARTNDPDMPLCFLLVLFRTTAMDTDGALNYGYKVDQMEYTGVYGSWLTVDNPVMETPHINSLGSNSKNIATGLPLIGSVNLASYQTIWQPFAPDADDPMGVGTVSDWYVTFAETADLYATGPANGDYVRVTTPGNLLESGTDTMYFVHPASSLGILIGLNPEYSDIFDLKGYTFECGTAEYLEVEFYSDTTDVYVNRPENFGYYIAQVAYDTPDGSDDDQSPPTIRTDANFPQNDSYPAFGNTPLYYAEWWYNNKNALLVGLHFDRYNFDLDPGDIIEILDSDGILIATLTSESVTGIPGSGGPGNPGNPGGGNEPLPFPIGSGPGFTEENQDTFVDLNATFGWVLVPGKAAQIKLLGDGDDNDGYSGFEVDYCGYVNGELTEIRDYVGEYISLAYDKYYDISADAIEAFRNLGSR